VLREKNFLSKFLIVLNWHICMMIIKTFGDMTFVRFFCFLLFQYNWPTIQFKISKNSMFFFRPISKIITWVKHVALPSLNMLLRYSSLLCLHSTYYFRSVALRVISTASPAALIRDEVRNAVRTRTNESMIKEIVNYWPPSEQLAKFNSYSDFTLSHTRGDARPLSGPT